MSDDEKARTEALTRWPNDTVTHRDNRGVFIRGARWQRSQPVEITDEMVERAARALYADSPLALYDERAGLITGAKPWEWLTPEYQDARRADARIALSAALGGEGR